MNHDMQLLGPLSVSLLQDSPPRQLFLPFWKAVPDEHLHWFSICNQADYPEKHSWFYPFKDQFLKTRAIPDGADLQIIKRKCRTCYGSGIWVSNSGRYSDICDRCDGSGIHSIRHIVLSRWRLGSHLYHIPEPSDPARIQPRETIHGLIQHPKVAGFLASRFLPRLLLRYAPKTWLRFQRARLIDLVCSPQSKIYQLRRAFQWDLQPPSSGWACFSDNDWSEPYWDLGSSDDIPF